MDSRWQALVRARLGRTTLDPARESDIVAELAQHAADHFADLVASGTPEDEAERFVLAPLSDPERIAAEIARADRPRPAAPVPPPQPARSPLDGLVGDVRYAAHLLRRAPAFAAAAVVTLALGIGTNTTIFTVLHAVLLRPLPFAEPSNLVNVGDRRDSGAPGNTGFATFLDWKAKNRLFEDMTIFRSWAPTLVVDGEPERIAGLRVSANFFRLLGAAPALGRDFTPQDDSPARWRVVILSDALWRRRFNADPAVVGRTLRMNDQDFRIVGVMPPSFEPLISEHFYRRADMWAALGYDVSLGYACRSCQHLKVIARLRPGVRIEDAAAEMNQIHAELRERFPEDYPASATIGVRPLADELSGSIRPALTALAGAVAFVLLIACANVGSLLLARFARRQHDLALRAALGASRARIVRQLLVESTMLAAAGGALGIGLSAWAVPLLVRIGPSVPRLADARIDTTVVAFTIALSLGTVAVFGLLPALRAVRFDVAGIIGGDGRRTDHAPASPARRLLVAVDVALAVVLLMGAGLMIRSVARLLGVDPGFSADGVLTMQISMGGQRYSDEAAVVRAGDDMLVRLRQLPGVTAAALAGQIPLGGNGDTWGFHIVGRPVTPEDPPVERYSVTPEYFSVMRIPLRRGRLISDADRAGTERVMLIGEHTASALWPTGDPLGEHVRIGGDDGPQYTIVGIVGDVRHHALAAPPTMQMYMAQRQLTDSFLTVVIRGAADVATLAGPARRAIWAVDHDIPVFETATLRDLVAKSVAPRRFVMLLLEVFGAIALLMTAVGIYGVIAYSVAERTREIGVRSALGATRFDIARLVMGTGFVTVAAGLAAGTACAAAATRALESSLFGVSATDPATFAVVAATLFAVTTIAQTIPVLRATGVDPAVALRQD